MSLGCLGNFEAAAGVGECEAAQFFQPFTLYNESNINLVDVRIAKMLGQNHSKISGQSLSQYTDPTSGVENNAFAVSDLFRSMPGVRVAPSQGFGHTILIRGCRPTVYLNGMRMSDDAASEIDMLATAQEVTAVEVYTAAGRPVQFWGNSCGSVVLWAVP